MIRPTRLHPWLLIALWLLPVAISVFALYLTWLARNSDVEVSQIAADARPAIVGIHAETDRPRLLQKERSPGNPASGERHRIAQSPQGTGILIDPSGIVVTNNHVIAGAKLIRVSLADGRTLGARVIGSDPTTDLALLKIDPGTSAPLPTLRFAESEKVRAGDPVIAIGNPLGYVASTSRGIISGLDRVYADTDPVGYIQHDAAINPGSSGGPILNRAGDVVGINTAIPDTSPYDIGIGLAIPAATIKAVVADLRQFGHVRRASLGITVQQLDAALAAAMGRERNEGLAISSVAANSPAEKAGILPGDIIERIGDNPLRKVRDLIIALSSHEAGQSVALTIARNGKSQRLDVRTAHAAPEEPRQPARRTATPRTTAGGKVHLGLTFAGEFRAKGLADAPERRRAVVADVDPDGAAYRAGVAPGDEILAIGNASVRNLDHAIELIGKTRLKFLALLVKRDEQAPRFVVLPLRDGARSDIDHTGNSVEPTGGPY